MTRFILPWPPTVNTYYRCVGGRAILSKAGREYKTAVARATLAQSVRRIDGPLKLELVAYPPDNRKRDLDNLVKPIQDALSRAGIYGDDSQIDRLVVTRGPVRGKPGLVEAYLCHYEPEGQQ